MNLKKCFAGSIFLAKIYILLSVHHNAKVIRNDWIIYLSIIYLLTGVILLLEDELEL